MITWSIPEIAATFCASTILLSMIIDGIMEKFRMKKKGRICQEETRDSRKKASTSVSLNK